MGEKLLKLGKEFFARDAKTVARELLGKVLVRVVDGETFKAKIVETEAYFDNKDPASRACKNGNLKEVMEDEPGSILVYGVHNNWLINFVTGKKGKAEAVLVRAVEPLNFEANTKGPGLLTKALKIDKSLHHKNLFNNKEIWIEENEKTGKGSEGSFEIAEAYRIGIKKDLPEKLRFYIKGNKFVSKK